MAVWTFYDYVELTGSNPIRKWLDALPPDAEAKVDYRLQQMEGMERWPDKWVSKYTGTKHIYELRICHNKMQYRPLGTYWGEKQFILLKGAIEKGDKIPKTDIQNAEDRLASAKKDARHVKFHEYNHSDDLEEDDAQGLS